MCRTLEGLRIREIAEALSRVDFAYCPKQTTTVDYVSSEMNMALRDKGISIECAEQFNALFSQFAGRDHESMARRREEITG